MSIRSESGLGRRGKTAPSTNQIERIGMNVEATARLFALGTETGKRGYRWCYIAGPMRGKVNWNYEAFNEAAKTLRDYGWHVFNPAETDAEVRDAAEKAKNPLSVYMQQDLVDVCKSDVVFVLEDWEDSEGARLEVTVAKVLQIPVYAFPQVVDILEDPIATEADFVAAGFPAAPVLDHVKGNGNPVVRRFDHEKGHLVDWMADCHVTEATVPVDDWQDVPLHPPVSPIIGFLAPRQFSSGASRNPDTNKPDYEGFNSPLVMEAFGRYMHEHRKQGDSLRSSDNWQKGIPLPEYMKSLWRHFLHVWLLHRGHEALDPDTGRPVTLEDALCGVLFNTNGYLHELLKGVDTVTHSG